VGNKRPKERREKKRQHAKKGERGRRGRGGIKPKGEKADLNQSHKRREVSVRRKRKKSKRQTGETEKDLRNTVKNYDGTSNRKKP